MIHGRQFGDKNHLSLQTQMLHRHGSKHFELERLEIIFAEFLIQNL